MIHYVKGCSLIPLIYNRKFKIHLDIRTGNISLNVIERNALNYLLRLESQFFKSISVISEGLKQSLKLPVRSFILPLGANPTIVERKLINKISLLYIGTLSNRRIEDTVVGLGLYLNEHPDSDIHYIIVGSGWGNEKELIKDKILEYNLERYVDLKGYIPNRDLKQFFEKSNLGVSYIPIEPWFEYQPATKTFEYLMAGIPVIATGTFENKKVINDRNGLIINDNSESFAKSLKFIQDKIDGYNEKLIRDSVIEYNWEAIVFQLKLFINNRIG
jgi:glycosyltransferase involved in cell wall biosynthesis